MQAFHGSIMIYKFLLSLLLLIQPYSIETQDNITDKTNIAEDDPSFSLNDTVGDIPVVKDTFGAGNSKCKQGSKCGFHQGTDYNWCDTDDDWQYCCTGPCTTTNALAKCVSGSSSVLCSTPSNRTISGKSCLSSHPCGSHGRPNFGIVKLWCYVDENKKYDYCCNPYSNCNTNINEKGNWCYTSIGSHEFVWHYCTP